MDDNQNQYMQEPEIPEFIIEDDGEGRKKMNPWLRRILKAVAVLLLFLLALYAYHLWNYYYNIGMPVSVSPSQNIEKLKQPVQQVPPQVVMSSDSILGVAMDFYNIFGLRANIEMKEPSKSDKSVFLYCRSSDYMRNGTYLGTLVVDGEEKHSEASRLGYMAMVDSQAVIGVARTEEVKDYVKEKKGSYFRQFVLVSDGVIPHQFYLHGKVERRAIAWKRVSIGGEVEDWLFFVATRYPETMWDFADALREYGFIDAVYITGGNEYCYYRSRNGVLHDIGSPDNRPDKSMEGITPWLVFRKY